MTHHPEPAGIEGFIRTMQKLRAALITALSGAFYVGGICSEVEYGVME